jgi:hypothetical protein
VVLALIGGCFRGSGRAQKSLSQSIKPSESFSRALKPNVVEFLEFLEFVST